MFCPALTDGALGDMLYFHSFRSPGLVIDIVQDIRNLNELARNSRKAGMIVLGGGLCKHQIANAMLIVSMKQFQSVHHSLAYSATAQTILCSSCVIGLNFSERLISSCSEHWARV